MEADTRRSMSWLSRKTGSLPLALWAFLGLLLALVPAGIVQVVLEQEARAERTQQLGQEAMRYVRLVGQRSTDVVAAARQVLTSIGAHDAVRAMQPSAECDVFLERIVAAHARYLTAGLFGLDGQAICLAHGSPPGLNVADRGYFQTVLRENSFQVGEYDQSRSTGQRILHFASPLQNDAGEVKGVLLVGLSIDWLIRDIQSVALPTESSAAIADRNGIILARSLYPERFVGQPMPAFAQAFLHEPQARVFEGIAMDGVRRIAAFIPLDAEPRGLFVVVGLDAAGPLAAVIQADRRVAVMIIGSLLLSFTLAIFVFHTVVERPVQRLLVAAHRWEAQDWGARVGQLRGGREFARLGAAFDEMAEAVTLREAARQQATARMQALAHVAPQIVLMADRAGQVDWTNDHWRQITHLDLAQSQGDGWLVGVHADDREAARAAWLSALSKTTTGLDVPFTQEARICRSDNHQWRWHLLTGAPIEDARGVIVAWAMVGVDFHERRQAEAVLAETAAQLRATYESAPVGLCLLDRELRFVAINAMLAGTNGQPVAAHIGRTLEEMAPHVAGQLAPVMRRVLETGEPIEDLEQRGVVAGEEHFWECNYYAVRGADGIITGLSGAIIDITTRKRIEASERLLSREVDHRAQNALSVVRGLVRLTAAEAKGDVAGLVNAMEGRIAAMGRAHHVLAREKWAGADLREIIAQETGSLAGQVELTGPDLRLHAGSAQPLSFVLHELVTNAVKHGALSTAEGRLTLRWEVRADGVRLDWMERGGPMIETPPTHAGFGSELIEANLRAKLNGRIECRWESEGLHAILTLGDEAFTPGSMIHRRQSLLSGRRILIAQDDPELAALLAGSLIEAGCVICASPDNIADALEAIAQAGALDAAILGGSLQGKSSRPLIGMLRRRAAVILLTEAPEGKATGLQILPAPVTPLVLREALAEALSRLKTTARGTPVPTVV